MLPLRSHQSESSAYPSCSRSPSAKAQRQECRLQATDDPIHKLRALATDNRLVDDAHPEQLVVVSSSPRSGLGPANSQLGLGQEILKISPKRISAQTSTYTSRRLANNARLQNLQQRLRRSSSEFCTPPRGSIDGRCSTSFSPEGRLNHTLVQPLSLSLTSVSVHQASSVIESDGYDGGCLWTATATLVRPGDRMTQREEDLTDDAAPTMADDSTASEEQVRLLKTCTRLDGLKHARESDELEEISDRLHPRKRSREDSTSRVGVKSSQRRSWSDGVEGGDTNEIRELLSSVFGRKRSQAINQSSGFLAGMGLRGQLDRSIESNLNLDGSDNGSDPRLFDELRSWTSTDLIDFGKLFERTQEEDQLIEQVSPPKVMMMINKTTIDGFEMVCLVSIGSDRT